MNIVPNRENQNPTAFHLLSQTCHGMSARNMLIHHASLELTERILKKIREESWKLYEE